MPINDGKKQMGNLDLLRGIAILTVVFVHCVTGAAKAHHGVLDPGLSKFIEVIHNHLLHWSVPEFFLLTGYFCGKHETYPYSFALKKVKKLVLVLFTVGLFYALLECVFTTRHLGIKEIEQSVLNVLNGHLWEHMWFIYEMIGVYLVLPVLFLFFRTSHEQPILVLLLFLFTIFFPWLGEKTAVKIDIGFPLTGYLFYVCFGMLFSACPPEWLSRRSRRILSVAWIVLGAVPLLLGVKQTGRSDLFVCFMATGFFILFLDADIPVSKGLTSLAKCTWGIYLIHPLFINTAVKFFKIDPLSVMPYGKLFVFYIAVVILSWFSVYVLKRIPLVKSLF